MKAGRSSGDLKIDIASAFSCVTSVSVFDFRTYLLPAGRQIRTAKQMALLSEGISPLYAGIDRYAVRGEAGLTLIRRDLSGGARTLESRYAIKRRLPKI